MRKSAKRAVKQARAPRARNGHGRQRQRLIDACISALHIYGPSQTTVEKVVAIAKMSPGIVRFYFASKAAMLVASLQFLSSEFEEQLLVPVTRLKSRPVAALELMVDLYLDPEIASPRKVSVWYAFWGEASSRQEYYDICGQQDEGFAALVRELIERLIAETGRTQLDADGVALGLIGVLEMLWQDFAFRTEADIDRGAAKRRAMAYLRSVFPGQFGAHGAGEPSGGEDRPAAAWVYANARQYAAEREVIFQPAWQLAGHQAQIPAAGDFFTVDLRTERVLVLRDGAGSGGRAGAGAVRVYRNTCGESPHILIAARGGHLESMRCGLHAMEYGLDGRDRGGKGGAALIALEVRLIGDLVLVRPVQEGGPQPGFADAWADVPPSRGARPLAPPVDFSVAADWKIVVEQWLAAEPTGGAAGEAGWSARRYRALVNAGGGRTRERRFLAPNHLLEMRADGVSVLQVLPVAPGRSLLRLHRFTSCPEERPARAASYLASRLARHARPSSIALAESLQEGLVTFGHEAARDARPSVTLSEFRRRLKALVPMMTLARPPNEP